MAVTETLGLEIVTEGLSKFLGDMKTADGAVGKTASGWEKAGGAIGKVAGTAFSAIAAGAAAAAAAVAVVGGAIVKLTLDAVPLKGISNAFEGIANTTTLGAEKMMAALQTGSYGMVSQIDLMKSFNNAAQLVSVDFAEKLPDALQYLGKISASTGEDMGFLVDSLVKGVGRLSGPIIDNLKIQVSLEEATARAAEMFGVEASELTKAQQQAGMMNVVLEKLKINTAAMPEVTGTAAQQMAAFKTQIQNTKDQIGMAFLPVLQQVLTPLLKLGEAVLPIAIEAIQGFATKFSGFIDMLQRGVEPVRALQTLLLRLGVPPEIINSVNDFATRLTDTFSFIVPFVNEAIQTMLPVFQEWGAFIMQVVGEVVAFINPLIESMAAFFVEKIEFLVAWAQTNLPLFKATFETALTTIKAIWDAVWPAIQLVVTSVWTVIQGVITVALTAITALITTVMQAIQGDWEGAWETIKTAAASIWETIKTAFGTFINGVLTAMGTTMDEFKATWQANWDTAVEIVTTIFDRIKTTIATQVSSFVELGGDIIRGVISGITGAAGALGEAVRGAAQAALNAAKAALGIDSPSKVFREQVGRNISAGIAAGIGDLAPQISAQVQAVTAPGGRGVMQSNASVTNNFNLTTNSLTRPGGLALEFATMGMGSR